MDAQENRILSAIIIAAAIFGVVYIYFTITLIRQQRKKHALQKQNMLAEVAQIEKERARMAHDLHDELGPLLSAIKMQINTVEISGKEDINTIERTNKHLDDVLRKIREISFNLMPNSLLRKGITTAAKEFVDYLNYNTKIKYRYNFQKDLKLSENNAVNLYRIIQEVIHNTIKHSKATEVQIELNTDNTNVILEIRDNGVGFDYKKESKENMGFGLKSLLRRTDIMGGKMYIESEIGNGTSYTFEIPVE